MKTNYWYSVKDIYISESSTREREDTKPHRKIIKIIQNQRQYTRFLCTSSRKMKNKSRGNILGHIRNDRVSFNCLVKGMCDVFTMKHKSVCFLGKVKFLLKFCTHNVALSLFLWFVLETCVMTLTNNSWLVTKLEQESIDPNFAS